MSTDKGECILSNNGLFSRAGGDSELHCSIGAMASGETVNIVVVVKPWFTGTLFDVLKVTSSSVDPDLSNNTSELFVSADRSDLSKDIPTFGDRFTPESPQDGTSPNDSPRDGGVGGPSTQPDFDARDIDLSGPLASSVGPSGDPTVPGMPGHEDWLEMQEMLERHSERSMKRYLERKMKRSLASQDAGDPVYLHSGEFYLYEEDLRIRGRGLDWVFARKYRSGVSFDGPLGHNWDFNYNSRLVPVTAGNLGQLPPGSFPEEPGTGDVIRMDGLGRVDVYQQQPDGSYVSPAGFYTGLERLADGSFVERDYRGRTASYSQPDQSGLARLTALQDRNGNRLRFIRNAQGQLVEVLDTLGRSIQYSYDANGHLTQVTDYFGRSIHFTYDINGNLVEVTSPAVTGTPNGNDFPQGKTVRYSYSSGLQDERLNHNLVSITAPNDVANSGPSKVTFTYANDPRSPDVDRVTSQTLGGTNHTGVPAGGTITYQYQLLAVSGDLGVNDPVARTTVTVGNQHKWDRLGPEKVIIMKSCVGAP